jgi:hypothetical protein
MKNEKSFKIVIPFKFVIPAYACPQSAKQNTLSAGLPAHWPL